jgi:hypothetical protein
MTSSNAQGTAGHAFKMLSAGQRINQNVAALVKDEGIIQDVFVPRVPPSEGTSESWGTSTDAHRRREIVRPSARTPRHYTA